MKNPTNDSKTTIDRRSVLKSTAIATGMGIVGVSGLSGAAGAQGKKGGSEPCEDCGGLLAKYEYDEEDGEFNFEKGRESLDIEGSDFDITVTNTKDDGEPLAFEVETDMYDFSCMTVKTGEGTFQKDYEWATSGSFDAQEFDEEAPVQAISNFSLCIDCAFWQVDFGTGTLPTLYTEEEEERDPYNEGDRWLLAAQTHGRGYTNGAVDEACGDLSRYTVNNGNSEKVEITDRIDIADDLSEATVSFEVLETVTVHMGVWEMPGPYDKSELEYGPLYDSYEEELEPATYERTVELPTV